MISRDGWPDCIRNVTHSNHIAETRIPEGVIASHISELRGLAAITLSLLGKITGYKKRA